MLVELDSLIYRHYTKKLLSCEEGATVYDLFEWKTVDVLIKDNETGRVITDMRGLEFPTGYSQSACDIIAGKYFRKKGVPDASGEREHEHSMKQVAHRLASFWTAALYDAVVITEEQRQIVYDELVYMLLAQIFAPNSPQWFNTGIELAYGVKGEPNGHFFYNEDIGDISPSQDSYSRTAGSACFILSVTDSLLGEKSLMEQMTTETKLFKFGSGAGSNWSGIRAKGETLSGGGESSGLLSFLKAFDRSAGAIKSGGVTRRAAKINVLNADHPEIMDFIKWKADEEDKAAALGKMGYSMAFGGEVYETVSGQNVNNTVRLDDAFMKAVSEEDGGKDANITLRGRVDAALDREVPAAEIFDTMAYSTWRCGDPGVQFDGVINAWHTCPSGSDGVYNAPHNRINASNPCSEYLFLDDSACNLASLNLLKFYSAEADFFDTTSYLHAIKMVMLILEATIHFGQFPTKDIALNSWKFRTTGLGMANLASLFMTMALPYDSDGARNLAAALASLVTGYSYYISSLIAEKTGPFDAFPVNSEHMLRVIRNHARAANSFKPDSAHGAAFEELDHEPCLIDHEILRGMGMDDISDALARVWEDALEGGTAFGFRNAQTTCIAPTGTVSLAMDCASTSIEPFYSHVTYKKLTGGGVMQMINPSIPQALMRLGYDSKQAEAITAHIIEKGVHGAPYLKPEHYQVFGTAGGGGELISPEGHVKMLGALSPHISGGISKTVNLPNNATEKDIKEIYIMAWRLGVKAVAVYRDGSKGSQPLNVTAKDEAEIPRKGYAPVRVKPAGIRSARVHEANIAGSIKLYITTSFYDDGRLGEIYVSAGRQGSLIKGLLDSISTMISEMLQYGVNPEDIARMYRGQKFEPSGFVTGHPYIKYVDSISDLISKIIDIELNNFNHCQVKPENIPVSGGDDGFMRLYGEICPVCKSDKMIRSGVCKVCTQCGQTTGCS